MNADSEFLRLCRELREAQRGAEMANSTSADRSKAAKMEYKFDLELAVMVKRQKPSLFDGES